MAETLDLVVPITHRGQGMNDDETKQLKEDHERLIQERNYYRTELMSHLTKEESIVAAQLKLLATSLSTEIQERFFSKLKTVLWVIALLAGVATFGGFWSLSDIIKNRIDDKVKEKEHDIQKLQEEVIRTVVEFKIKAAQAIDDVSKEGESAKVKIRSTIAVIEKDGLLKTTVVEDTRFWYGNLPNDVLLIGSSRSGPGYERRFADVTRSFFSYHFEKTLTKLSTDKDNDGYISVAEAFDETRVAVTREESKQEPELRGSDKNSVFFKSNDIKKQKNLYKKFFALLIGINTYPTAPLSGPVNDISAFQEILNVRNRIPADAVDVISLINENATTEAIMKQIKNIEDLSTSEDFILIYYAGHVTELLDAKGQSPKGKVRALAPFDFEVRGFIIMPDMLLDLGKAKAKQKLIIIDG